MSAVKNTVNKTFEWSTPQGFFDRMNAMYDFDLDAAATAENAKCNKFFTLAEDGLAQSWAGHRVWCNPPYGREVGKWVKKGYEESEHALVVMLLPASTDTGWFHDYCLKGDVMFLRGRLKFGESKNNATFSSMVVVFDRRELL